MQAAGNKEPEAMATCPYNPAHRLPLFRMKRHLVKCKLNGPAVEELVTCPLNITHRVPQPELAYHIETCPDRVNLDRKFQIPEVIDRVLQIEAADISPPTDECWDDAAHPTYDPTKHVMEKPIFRIKNCESKAKRLEFRQAERSRIARLHEEEQHLTAANRTGGLQARELMANTSASAQCRRPLTKSAGVANKPNLDPYKVNDILQALDQDQKKLLNTIQTMGEQETLTIFPIEDNGVPTVEEAVKENIGQNTFEDNEFPFLGGGGKSNGANFQRRANRQ